MAKPRSATVDVVIVNWNAGTQLRECVDSLIRFGDGQIAKIIVVDNGSTDGSIDLIAGTPAIVDRTGENLGFGRACNRGAALSDGPYILFLNPDTAIFAGTVARVLGLMEGPDGRVVGVCGVRMINDEAVTLRKCAKFPSWLAMIGQPLGLSGKLDLFPAVEMRNFDHLSNQNVDHVMGAFYFIRRSIFSQLQGFDSRYFVYYEDLDLSLRVSHLGWQIRYLADVAIYHKGGGTSERAKAHRLFYVIRSRIFYSFKYYRWWQAWLFVIASITVEPLLRIARALIQGSFTEVAEVVAGMKMLAADLPRILRQSTAKVSRSKLVSHPLT